MPLTPMTQADSELERLLAPTVRFISLEIAVTVGDSYRPTTKIGDAVRKCGKHYYAICELHGSEMCGREINKLATDLISKILISRGHVK
jgi:hypothetical protein